MYDLYTINNSIKIIVQTIINWIMTYSTVWTTFLSLKTLLYHGLWISLFYEGEST